VSELDPTDEARFEVTETVQAREAADPHRCYLDRPKPGRYGAEVVFLGWVLPAAGEIERVELRAEDSLIAQTTLNLPRPDLAEGFPDSPDAEQCGFRMVVILEDVPRSGELDVTALLVGGERVPIGTVRVRPIVAADEPRDGRTLSDASERQATEQRLRSIEKKLDVLRTPVVTRTSDVPLPPIGVIRDFLTGDESADVLRKARQDELPLPHAENREGYASNDHVRYWTSGLEDHEKVMNSLGPVDVSKLRLYDFGGSTGRVFRHFYCQTDAFEIWSSDFKLSSYRWNQRYMPKDIRCFLNTFYPSIPVADRYFDVITAFSVFTHIDELESPWLLELRRILKPKGLLYLTVHDETFWDEMPDHFLVTLQQSSGGAGLSRESPFPGDRAAFHFTEESYYSCNVFHSRHYIDREWGRVFDVLKIIPLAHSKQSVVLLTYDEVI
jgi:SAM-dependent methyltransferase